MKKIKIALASLSILLLPVMAFAINNPVPNPTGAQIGSIQSFVNKLLTQLWIVFAAIAVICFLIAGILFLTAAGDPDKIKTARNAFLWGVAGVVVGVISYSIIAIVGSLVG